MNENSTIPFPVVAIGCSAGGLEPLTELIRRLAPGSMAFVVLQHAAPGRVTMLAEILRRATTLNVFTTTDGMPVEPSTIYVVPAIADVTIEQGRFHLTPPTEARWTRHPIDAFMQMLACVNGSLAVGVILSGTGNDGTRGLKAIKEAGGSTFVQEPTTAAHGDMPRSALDAGVADRALGPADIGDELMHLRSSAGDGGNRPVRELRPDALQRVFAELRHHYDVDFGKYKPGTIMRRLERRMAARGKADLEDYVGLLQRDSVELEALYDDLLIGTTGFFRDHAVFDALKTVIFPRLLWRGHQDSAIRIWVPGCSTGEEAYSVAIALLEFLGNRADSYKIQIFATDIDERALAQARTGTYSPRIEADVSAARLKRFFARVEGGYRIASWVRSLILFAHHNVARDPPFSRIDLVSCRNVLIYMDSELQRHVLRLLHYALNPQGVLLLGTAETVAGLTNAFSVVDPTLKVFVKTVIPLGMPLVEFDLPDISDHDEPGKALPVPLKPERRSLRDWVAAADRAVIDKYAPPRVIIDEACKLLEHHGRTEPFLEPVPSGTKPDIFQVLRPELREVLREAVNATAHGSSAESPAVPIAIEGVAHTIALEVIPLIDHAECKARLVLFKEKGDRRGTSKPPQQRLHSAA